MIKNPHLLFYALSVLFLILGLSAAELASFDVNIHDTYIVLGVAHVYYFISLILGIVGVAYQIIRYKGIPLFRGLIGFHIGLTLFALIVAWVLTVFYRTETGPVEEIMDNLVFNSQLDFILVLLLPLSLCLILILLPVNVLWTCWKAWKEARS